MKLLQPILAGRVSSQHGGWVPRESQEDYFYALALEITSVKSHRPAKIQMENHNHPQHTSLDGRLSMLHSKKTGDFIAILENSICRKK